MTTCPKGDFKALKDVKCNDFIRPKQRTRMKVVFTGDALRDTEGRLILVFKSSTGARVDIIVDDPEKAREIKVDQEIEIEISY